MEAYSEHRALQDQSWLDGEHGNAVFAGRCEPCLAWTKASTRLSHGHVGAGYIGLGSQPDSNNSTALGHELNLTQLGLSLPWVCSETSRRTQHIYLTDMENLSTESGS